MGLRVDPRDRFSATVELYRKHRPSYPPALIDWLVRGLAPGAPACDLGCGTGISSRLLAARGLQVIGIDPNEAMLAEARRDGGGPSYRRGEAAATGLADGSVDLVTAAQAFHWFELEPTMREIARILRRGGRAAAFWNVRARTPAMDEYDALLRRWSAEYGRMRGPDATVAAIRAFPGLGRTEELELENAQALDREAFHGRVWSSSYVVHGVDDREGLERELATFFDRHAEGGVLQLRYRVIAIAWGR